MEVGSRRSTLFRDPAKSVVERLPNDLIVVHKRPGLMHEPHWHAQVEVNFVFRGDVAYRMYGYDMTLKASELGLFWGGLPHQMVGSSEDALFIAVHLPLVQFFRLGIAAELTDVLTRGATIRPGQPDPTDAGNFERWSMFMRSGDAARANHAIEELLLRIDRIRFEDYRAQQAESASAVVGTALDSSQSKLVWQLCQYICDNFRENIDLLDVAAAADMHPKSAMRAFKRSTGMTLHKYLSLLRLSYAQALLMNDDINVLDVAMESGFGSLGAFNTSFARLAGKSPSQFRRDARLARAILFARKLGSRPPLGGPCRQGY